MKNYFYTLIQSMENELEKIHKSQMKLADRIAYEKMVTHLKDLRAVLYHLNVTST